LDARSSGVMATACLPVDLLVNRLEMILKNDTI